MSSTFTGFSEEDLKRIKSGESGSDSVSQINTPHLKKLDKIGVKTKKTANQYKLPRLQKQDSDDNLDGLFEKCKLSIKTPTSPPAHSINNNNINNNSNVTTTEITEEDKNDNAIVKKEETASITPEDSTIRAQIAPEDSKDCDSECKNSTSSFNSIEVRRKSSVTAPDIVRCVDNYTEDDLATHKVKLEELQLQQRIMEEQNKRRKEMLAKALADRTKQTAEEVQRLEKIKKELQILDGQFSQDVALLRKKIDQACLSYADAEKQYLKVEKEFLHAKIQLQKEKEKKELLTEHLCALITHNETRKAQKLETLMLELASDKKVEVASDKTTEVNDSMTDDDDEKPVIVDGVDEKTGKMVEFTAA